MNLSDWKMAAVQVDGPIGGGKTYYLEHGGNIINDSTSSSDDDSGYGSEDSAPPASYMAPVPQHLLQIINQLRTSTNSTGEMTVMIFLEPGHQNPYLVRFYDHPHIWGAIMQAWIMQNRLRAYWQGLRVVIDKRMHVGFDRSIFTDKVFVVLNHRIGQFSDRDFDRYMEIRAEIIEGLPEPTRRIYLQVELEVVKKRIANRSRDGECHIPDSYLQGLHEVYLEMIDEDRAAGKEWEIRDYNAFEHPANLANDISAAPQIEVNGFEEMIRSDDELERRLTLILEWMQELVVEKAEEHPEIADGMDEAITQTFTERVINASDETRRQLALDYLVEGRIDKFFALRYIIGKHDSRPASPEHLAEVMPTATIH